MIKVVADKVKCHDMLFMACNPSFYAKKGLIGQRSCAANIAEALNEAGILLRFEGDKATQTDDGDLQVATRPFNWWDVHDPFNVFQNTPYYSLKALECSRKGDWIEFQALLRCVVALSSCPYDQDGFNGGEITDVGIVWEEE
jgi:hypothetical protein